MRRGRMRLLSPKLEDFVAGGGGEDLLRALLMVVVTLGFMRLAESRRPSQMGLLGGSRGGIGLREMRNLPCTGGVDVRWGIWLAEGVLRWPYREVDSGRRAPVGKAESSSMTKLGPLDRGLEKAG